LRVSPARQALGDSAGSPLQGNGLRLPDNARPRTRPQAGFPNRRARRVQRKCSREAVMSTILNAPPEHVSVEDEQVWGRVLEIARSHVNGWPASGGHVAGHGTLLRGLGAGVGSVYIRCGMLDDARSGSRLVVVALEHDTSLFPSAQELRKRFRLTRREAEVALLVAERRSTQEIAELLFVTTHTVRRHI